MKEAYPRNAAGPFYIENNCCITCGVPVDIAPDLFSWDLEIRYPGHCFVSRQPANRAEIDLMIDVMKQNEVDCLRYRGGDNDLRDLLISKGHETQCD